MGSSYDLFLDFNFEYAWKYLSVASRNLNREAQLTSQRLQSSEIDIYQTPYG
jgi:hypothetical protein